MSRKRKILVVDDDATYRQLFTFQLTSAGYEVFIAHDGQEALNWINQQRLDLILLDLLMPRMSGIEVLQRIKALDCKTPVMLVSGAEWPIARQGVELGEPSGFLTKPFTMEDLLAKVKMLLLPVSDIETTSR
ncbi:hypothetical protein GCM10028803_48630 [Larkinella knui]|uniref:Response regulator n=1 Tax=Larkinella knui TaxID=2025310 RepID=A0A3P1CQT0_9BACT|nr:response regulator [Larkinella knui]RRB15436.1 response regulator [Larkinella knui]